MNTASTIILRLFVFVMIVSPAPGEVRETTVYTRGENEYFGYRIPAVVATDKGVLLAFAEARRDDMKDDGKIDLVVKRSDDGGRSWSEARIVHADGDHSIGNPCPVIDRNTGRIWLPLCRNNREVFITYSDDDGQTWSPPREITANVKKPNWRWYATGPGVGIQTREGRLIVPANHSSPGEFQSLTSHIIYSDDNGETWQLGGALPRPTPDSPSSNEAQVVELADGRLMINVRISSREPDFLYRGISYSEDGGDTWTEMKIEKALIDPTCQGTILRYSGIYDEGRSKILFANPASQERRRNLTVRLSEDEGKTWPQGRTVYEGFSGYSCLVALPDGDIGIFYEKGFRVEDLVFARFSLNWLTGGGK